MISQKATLMKNGDMSQATLTSTPFDCSDFEKVGMHLTWDGGTGTIAIQGTIDGADWVALSLPTAIAPAGSAGSVLLDLVDICCRQVRAVYTRSSGSGNLNISAIGKGEE